MHSSGSIIKTYLEKLRHYLDDPDLDAKYDDNYLVRFFLSSAMTDVIARVSMMADNQIMCLLNVSVVSGTTYYKLPPAIKQVLRIGIQDPSTGWFIEDFKPRNEFSLFGPGWALEGNLLSFRPTPSQAQTYLVLYVPSGDVAAHYGTGTLNANNTFTLATTPTIGSLDKRDNAYAGSYLRIFGTNLIDELLITSYDPVTRVVQLRNPPANATALTYTYEVIPFLMEPMTDAISLSAAMRAGVGRKISNAQLQALSFEYKQAIKTAHDTLGNMNARIGKRFTGTVDPVAGFTVGGSGSGATTGTCAPCGSAGGDLGGSYPNPTVDGLQGQAVSAVAPTNGQVLTWVAASSAWVPVTPTGGGSGTVTSVTPAADNGSGTAITTSGTITVAGTANEVTTSVTGTTITVGLPDEVTVVDLNTDRVDFNTSPASTTSAVGRELWDSTYSTLSLGISSNVDLKYGQALYKRARNDQGSQISKGQVVYLSGSHALTEAMVKLADADAESTSANTIGIAAEDIAINTTGLIQVFGYLTGLTTNTSAYPTTEGEPFYLSSTAGGTSPTLPTQPKHGVRIGFLIKRAGGGSGSVFISPQNYQELEELSDVLIGTTGGGTALADNDLLQYDSGSSVWRNTTIANAGVAAASHVHSGADITSGTLAVNYGGTGQTTAVAAFDALAPTTTKGDIIAFNGTDNVRLAVGGTDGHVLTVDSSTATGLKWDAKSSVTINEQTYDSSGTFTKNAACQYVVVEMCGGGGGGGSGTIGGAAGSGGCAGMYWSGVIMSADLGTSTTITIGAGGAAGVNGSDTILTNATTSTIIAQVAGGRANSNSGFTEIGSAVFACFGSGGGSNGNTGRHGGKGAGGGGGGHNASTSGSAGGRPCSMLMTSTAATGGGGAAGGTLSGNGASASSANDVRGFGEGGGGAGGTGATVGNGGAGRRGSGGGGGGATASAAGTGGAGGAGFVRIVEVQVA